MVPHPPPTARAVWTIGHSNHSLQRFVDLLAQHRIALLADVRSSPYSAYASHFNKEAVQDPLQARGIAYLFLGDLLGGRAEGPELYDAQGHVLYDRLADSSKFRRGLDRLLQEIARTPTALMCGEEDPTDCHRRLLVGRVLADHGVDVIHIRGDGRIQSEDEVATQQWFRKTKGQLTLFDLQEPDEWKSTRSVSPSKAPPSSSRRSSGPQSAE